ncbi:MAG: response regulator [Candidatus Margulisbacteria bacterium]|nr:response regulator [Candidatus Margulisiibacteriota bacterium]MBU1021191.1 response regulator [Candidatus Margulisiibacteriota bacterium]MBU1729797.1 response regulator [Candidatus Margulisiibacteriota bacterium]MBU1955298.1 response regulator [Candidatus Margulisiibacteriota bacterium]
MSDKEIILYVLTDDEGVKSFLSENLKNEAKIDFLQSVPEAIEKAKAAPPAVFIIDYHLKAMNGLEVYKLLKTSLSDLKVIMLSVLNSIPLAVSAAKQGVDEFLRKPLHRESFLKALHELIEESYKVSSFDLPKEEGMEWLFGRGTTLKNTIVEAEKALKGFKDIIIVSEAGIDSLGFAKALHANGRLPGRKFVVLDLASFEKESSESHFWTMLQKLLTLKEGSLETEEELCGTILLVNFEALEFHFRHSILEFLKNKSQRIGAEKLDKKIRIMVTVSDKEGLSAFTKDGLLDSFYILSLPSLRDRKNDLPKILVAYIEKYNRDYAKQVKYISTECLDLLFYSAFRGNYKELEDLVAIAILRSQTEYLGVKDLPLTLKDLEDITLAKLSAKRFFEMNLAEREFDDVFLKTIFEKASGDADEAARFLSISKLALQEQIS